MLLIKNDRVKLDEMGRACRSHGSEEAYVEGKPEGKRAIRGRRSRWEDTVKMDRGEI
jgi:hypothetical protein